MRISPADWVTFDALLAGATFSPLEPNEPEVTIVPSNRRDTAKGITDETKGRVKEAVGKATGNRRLQVEGKMDQAKGKVRKASGRVKRAARDVKQAVDRATR